MAEGLKASKTWEWALSSLTRLAILAKHDGNDGWFDSLNEIRNTLITTRNQRVEPPAATVGQTEQSVFELGEYHGCLTGDCPHDSASECVESLREYVKELCEAGWRLEAELLPPPAPQAGDTCTLAGGAREWMEAGKVCKSSIYWYRWNQADNWLEGWNGSRRSTWSVIYCSGGILDAEFTLLDKTPADVERGE